MTLTLPTTGVNQAKAAVTVSSYAEAGETPVLTVTVVAEVGATWKNVTDVFATHIMVSTSSYTAADLPAPVSDSTGEATETTETETTEETTQAYASLVFNLVVSLFLRNFEYWIIEFIYITLIW